MAQNQGLNPNTGKNLRGKDGNGIIGIVLVILAVIVIVGAATYTPKMNTVNPPNGSEVVWPAGTFQLVGFPETNGHSGTTRLFVVYSNMTNVEVRGSFTVNNGNIQCDIGSLGPNISLSLPILPGPPLKVYYSVNNVTNGDISISLPTPSSGNETYEIQFSNPDIANSPDVNVTTGIVLTYGSSGSQSTNRTILIASENNPLPKTGFYPNSSNVIVYGNSSISISYGQSITLSIEMYNEGNTSVEKTLESSWPVKDGLVRGPSGNMNSEPGYYACGAYYPYGFVVYMGNVSNANLANVTPLDLVEPGVYLCPDILLFSNYTIEAHSDNAILTGPNPPFNMTLFSSITFNGYYTQEFNSTNNSLNQTYQFNYFPQGDYTIAVEDEWGAIAFLHFRVS